MTADRQSLQAFLDTCPFHKLVELEISSMDESAGQIGIRMPYQDKYQRIADSGQIHGGAIASLVDIAGCYALVMALDKGIPTVNFRVDYLRPAVNTDLLAQATIRRSGRSVGVVDIDVTDDEGRLIAVGRGCYGTS